jgi:hypothetical protein
MNLSIPYTQISLIIVLCKSRESFQVLTQERMGDGMLSTATTTTSTSHRTASRIQARQGRIIIRSLDDSDCERRVKVHLSLSLSLSLPHGQYAHVSISTTCRDSFCPPCFPSRGKKDPPSFLPHSSFKL